MNLLNVKTQESLSRVLRKVKTSDKDYEVFKKTFMRVVEMLGLTQYEYTFTKLKNCDDDAGVAFEKFGEKTTLVRVVLPTGFELVEASACVDHENYSEKYGAEICMEKIKARLWFLMGFTLQWAHKGLKAGGK